MVGMSYNINSKRIIKSNSSLVPLNVGVKAPNCVIYPLFCCIESFLTKIFLIHSQYI